MVMNVQTEDRNVGIDLLKIFAMFLIIVGHLIVQYGIGSNLKSMDLTTYMIKLLGTISSGAVNCYALCTGYLMIKKTSRPARLVDLWFQIIFYSVLITIIFYLLQRLSIIPHRVNIGTVQWLTSLTPITRNSWWYASCYFGLFLLIPIVNNIVNNSSKQNVARFIYLVLIIASLSAFLYGDGLCMKFGYSVTWLVVMYVVGAYIKLYGVPGNNHLIKWGGVILITWILGYLLDLFIFFRITGSPKSGNILCLYTSPLTILASIELFMFFVSYKGHYNIKLTHFLSKVSVATFGVYLIHTHDVVWDYFQDYFAFPGKNPFEIVVITLCLAFSVFLISCLIDIIRQDLFIIIKIKQLSEFIAGKIRSLDNKIISIINC